MNENTSNSVVSAEVVAQASSSESVPAESYNNGVSDGYQTESPDSGSATEGAETPKPQSKKENSGFAAARREAERQAKEAKEQLKRANEANERILSRLKKWGVDASSVDDAIDIMDSQDTGKTVDEIRQERSAAEEARRQAVLNSTEYMEMQSEVQRYRAAELQRLYDADMKAIKDAYPDCHEKDIWEIGQDFIQLRKNGVDPVIAYRYVRERADSQRKPEPPVLEALGANTRQVGYLSKAEVDRMSPEEVEKNIDLIKRSMPKWK